MRNTFCNIMVNETEVYIDYTISLYLKRDFSPDYFFVINTTVLWMYNAHNVVKPLHNTQLQWNIYIAYIVFYLLFVFFFPFIQSICNFLSMPYPSILSFIYLSESAFVYLFVCLYLYVCMCIRYWRKSNNANRKDTGW